MSARSDAMPQRFVTAGAVARRAGVSRSTVSRAFTPGRSVSAEAKRRVIAAAEEMGYRVNRLAQGLGRAGSPLVGLVGANLATPFHASQVAALSAALLAQGMQCLVLNADRPGRDMAPLIANLLEFRARAVVILSGTPSSAIVAECRRAGLRVILINKPLPGVAAHTILCDDASGARLAADRLLAAGCRHLALVGSASFTASITGRMQAFRAHLARRRIEPVVWSEGATGYETGFAAARALLGNVPIDGAFCATDLIAMGFLDGARYERGRRVPADLSVVGFDDIPEAAWRAYALTTIRQSIPRLVAAVMAAIARDDEPDTKQPPVILPVALIERKSVREQ